MTSFRLLRNHMQHQITVIAGTDLYRTAILSQFSEQNHLCQRLLQHSMGSCTAYCPNELDPMSAIAGLKRETAKSFFRGRR